MATTSNRYVTVGIVVLVCLCWTCRTQSADPPVSPLADLGDSFHTVSPKVVSPHVHWAHPLPDGPVRTLVIGPRRTIREAVELQQRMHADFDAVIVHSTDSLGHPENRLTIKGVSTADVTSRLVTLLKAKWDLLIIGNVRWSTLPANVQGAILNATHGGAGLLVLHDDESFSAVCADMQGETISVTAFAPSRIFPFASADDPQQSLADAVRAYRHGRGRIVTLHYPNHKAGGHYCLTTNAPMPQYEFQQLLVVKLAMAAAQRKFSFADMQLKVGETAEDGAAYVRVTGRCDQARQAFADLSLHDVTSGRIVRRSTPVAEEQSTGQ